jgi:hypothetical protein
MNACIHTYIRTYTKGREERGLAKDRSGGQDINTSLLI